MEQGLPEEAARELGEGWAEEAGAQAEWVARGQALVLPESAPVPSAAPQLPIRQVSPACR